MTRATASVAEACPQTSLGAERAASNHTGMELPISHQDVTTTMRLLGEIQNDVRAIRLLLEEDDGEEEEEAPEDDT